MDQNSLVTDRIEEGRAILDRCFLEDVDIAAACWIKLSEDGRWYFYIATKVVEDRGLTAAYKAILGVIRRMNRSLGMDTLEELKVVGATNPMAREVLDIQSQYPAPLATRYRGNRLGNFSIEEAYIYPPRHPAEASV